jgi:SulP family sulfate permease
MLYPILTVVGVVASAYFIKSKTEGPWRFILPLIIFSIISSLFHFPIENIHDYLARTTFIEHINDNTEFQPFIASSTDFTFDSVQESLITGIVLAIIGLTETLMALAYVDEKIGTKGNANKETLAQGIGNLLCGIFGGIGGAGLLGQSAINAKSKTSTRLSTLSTVAFLLLIAFTIDTVLIYIPTVVVAGIMIFIAIDIFSMSSINSIKNMPKGDAFTLIFVTCATIVLKPTMAVISGVIFAALIFSWENATRIRVRKKTDQDGRRHFEVYGPLFFASTSTFLSKFEIETDPDEIVLNFSESRIRDQSGIESVVELCNLYAEAGKKVSIIHLSRDSKMLIEKIGNENIHIIVDKKDPVYHVVGENNFKWKRYK